MASTFLADNYNIPLPEGPGIGVAMIREFAYTITAAGFIVNDLVKLCPLTIAGTGLVLDSYFVDVPDLDSASGVTLDLGDNTSAAKYVAASTVGRSPGYLTPAVSGVAASLPALYTANNDLVLKIHAAPTGTATSGTIKGWAKYHQAGPGCTA